MAVDEIVDVDESSSIDVDAAQDIINRLRSAAGNFKSGVPWCSNFPDIAILAEAGFDTSACDAYDKAVQEFSDKLFEASKTAGAYVEAVQSSDLEIENEIPEEIEETEGAEEENTEGDGTTTAGSDDVSTSSMSEVEVTGGSNEEGKSGESDFDPDAQKEELEKVNDRETRDSYNELVTRCQKSFDNMSKETLESIKNDLTVVAANHNITLEQLIKDDKYAQVILETITKNSNIDKNVAKDMKIIGQYIVRKVLSDILTNKKGSNLNAEELAKKCQNNFNNMSKETLESIKKDLTVVAANHNMTLEQLIKDDKYAQVVLETITKNSDINPDVASNMEEVGQDIVRKSLYNVLTNNDNDNINGTGGNGLNVDEIIKQCETYYRSMPKETLESILSGLYTESVKNNISLEQLLTDNKYSQVVLNVIVNNNKVDPSIITSMKALGQDVSREVLSNIFTGNNNVLGISKSSKEYFRAGFSQVVKEKNLNTTELINGNSNELRTVVSNVKELFATNNVGDDSNKLVDVLLGLNDNNLLSYMIIDLFR